MVSAQPFDYPFPMAALSKIYRIHDVCTGVVKWKQESGYKQLYVSLRLSDILQHAVGCLPTLGTPRSLWQYQSGICKS